MKIDQVIVVEGKTDTQKLKQIFGSQLETIETNGLNVNEELLSILKNVNNSRGIIILTDPDGPGQKIREQINQGLACEVKNAFISRPLIKTRSKIGVAEANPEEIKQSLSNLITFNSQNQESISWNDYLENDWFQPKYRQIISHHFSWSQKISSKTLFKWLNLAGLKKLDIELIIKESKE
ncbi:ribonuclease M5 [Spiroplasma alleghenense]|uniref:Ribonuclease M5 n=1 Tax=Spiroplasma alleghenense TaxID=216931 RepID=A0A345Z5B8_9MOLU|nr:ribonuclease M5 [Spiroplasma alleghenense]AXK51797.1 ribonuclease M5 [Spiroplasma alleghenense]